MIFPKGKGSAIGLYDSLISDEDCDYIIDSYEQLCNFHFLGKTVGGVDQTVKKTTDLHIVTNGDRSIYTDEEISIMAKIDKILFIGVNKLISSYMEEFKDELSSWFEPFDTGYQLQRYYKNQGFYKEHCDGGAYTPYPMYQRVLGIVIYLNTVKEGGGTKFPLQNYTVKPIKGRASVFPANFTHPHIAEIPVSDDKYICSTFAMSYVLDVNGNRVPLDHYGHEIIY
jgi:hypothetical protein